MFFTTKPETKNTKFEKTEFMRFDHGVYNVRIVSNPVGMFSHYVPSAKISIKCLQEDCPICKNNRQLMIENPDNFRNIKGWNPRQFRHYFNVLDITPVKVCENCGNEITRSGNNFPSSCSACNAIIPHTVKESPSLKIKLASISDTNATLINTQAQGFIDNLGDSFRLSDFIVMFTVIKSDGKKTIIPSLTPSQFSGEIDESKLYDSSKALVTLTSEEIVDTLKGISLKDIYAARRMKSGEDTEDSVVTDLLSANKAVEELFGK